MTVILKVVQGAPAALNVKCFLGGISVAFELNPEKNSATTTTMALNNANCAAPAVAAAAERNILNHHPYGTLLG